MKKARIFRPVLYIIIIVISISIIGAALFIKFFPKDEIKQMLTARAEESLNKKVTITGLSLGFEGVILEGVSIYNGLSAGDELLFSAEEAGIRFSFFPLLKKQLIIRDIILNHLKVNITYSNGRFNLQDFFKNLKQNGGSSVKTSISGIKLKDAEITLQNPPDYLKPLEGRYIFNGYITIPGKKELVISDSRIILPENRGIVSPEMKIRIFDKDFEIITDVSLKDCSLLWVYRWGKNLNLPYTNFTGDVKDLKITRTSVEGIADGVSILTSQKPLNVYGTCRVNILGRWVSLIEVTGKTDSSRFIIKNLSFTTKGKIIGFDVDGVDSSLYDLKTLLSFLPEHLYGRVEGRLSYDGALYNGVFNLKNVGYSKETGLAGNINTDINLKNNTIYKENIQADVFNQPCLLSVATVGNDFSRIAINLSARDFIFNFDKNKIPQFGGSEKKSKLQFSGRVDILSLNIKDYIFQNFSANYLLADKSLTLNKISAKFMGGGINANGNIDMQTGTPEIHMQLSFDNIKVHDLANTMTEYKGRFFGIAKGAADVGLRISKNERIIDTIFGKTEFSIDNGKIVDTGIQKRLGLWLSELKYKLKDLEFNKIYGNFSASGGNYNINSLICKASEIELNLNGAFSGKEIKDLGDEKLPRNLKIVLKFNENFIRDLPSLSRGAIMIDSRLSKKDSWYEARWPQM